MDAAIKCDVNRVKSMLLAGKDMYWYDDIEDYFSYLTSAFRFAATGWTVDDASTSASASNSGTKAAISNSSGTGTGTDMAKKRSTNWSFDRLGAMSFPLHIDTCKQSSKPIHEQSYDCLCIIPRQKQVLRLILDELLSDDVAEEMDYDYDDSGMGMIALTCVDHNMYIDAARIVEATGCAFGSLFSRGCESVDGEPLAIAVIDKIIDDGGCLGDFFILELDSCRDACKNGHTELIKLILEYHEDEEHNPYDYEEDEDEEYLHRCNCCKSGRFTPSDCIFSALDHIEIVELLLEHGADVHARNCKGDIPIMHAFKKNNWELVKLFLDMGTDMYLPNNKNFTCANIAPPKLYKKAVEYEKKQIKERKRERLAKAKQ